MKSASNSLRAYSEIKGTTLEKNYNCISERLLSQQILFEFYVEKQKDVQY